MIILLLIFLELIWLLLIVGISHWVRKKIGIEQLIVLLVVVVVIVQWLSDLGTVVIFQGFPIFISSVVFFPAVLLGLFLIFVFDGPVATRRLFFGLLIGEILYMISVIGLYCLALLPDYLKLDHVWFLNHSFSTLAVIADFYFLTYVWSVLSKKDEWLLLKVLGVFLVVCWIDTIVFVLGAYGGNGDIWEILQVDLISRAILALIIGPFAYFYILLEKKRVGFQLEARYPWSVTVLEKEAAEQLKKAEQRISQLECMQLQLKETEVNLEEAQRIGKFGNFIWNLNKKTVYWSENSFAIHGFKPTADLTPPPLKDYFARIHPEDRQSAKKSLNSAIKTEGETEIIYRVMFPDHSIRYVKVRSQLTFDSQHKPMILKGLFQDITHDVELEQMKTEFISLASHQLRTPLTAVKWYLEMLMHGDAGKMSDDANSYLENINTANERMIQLINALLNFSKLETGRMVLDPQLTSIDTILTEVLAELDARLKDKNLEVDIKIEDQLPKIIVDSKMIRQVYMNLISNSIKYTDLGGQIKIAIYKKNNELISQISDNGCGIPNAEQSRIFEKFFRASNAKSIVAEGTGLGLYFVKLVVQASDGRVWFESKKNVGTSFWFSLPVA